MIDFLALAVDGFLFRQLFHHRFGNLVTTTTPNIHHFVIAFALRHQTLAILLFDFFHFHLCRMQQGLFLAWHQHIIHTNRQTATSRISKTGVHQLIGKNHRIAQTATAERSVDEFRNFFLFQRFIDVLEAQAFWQNIRQQSTTNGGFMTLHHRLEVTVLIFFPFTQTNGDTGTEFDLTGFVGTMHLGHIREQHAFAVTIDFVTGQIVQTQHNILRRHNDWFAVSWRQYVVRRQHQGAGFHLCL